jgi:mono/diheme cytochrome c family protein
MRVIRKMKKVKANMKWFRPKIIILASLLVVLLAACSSDQNEDKASEEQGQIAYEDVVIDETRIALLKRSCMSCHGVNLQGIPGDGPPLKAIGARMSEEEIMDILKNGKGNGSMPKGLLEGGNAKEGDLEMMVKWLSEQK